MRAMETRGEFSEYKAMLLQEKEKALKYFTFLPILHQ